MNTNPSKTSRPRRESNRERVARQARTLFAPLHEVFPQLAAQELAQARAREAQARWEAYAAAVMNEGAR